MQSHAHDALSSGGCIGHSPVEKEFLVAVLNNKKFMNELTATVLRPPDVVGVGQGCGLGLNVSVSKHLLSVSVI